MSEFIVKSADDYCDWAEENKLKVNDSYHQILADADKLCRKCRGSVSMLCPGERQVFSKADSDAFRMATLRGWVCGRRNEQTALAVMNQRLDQVRYPNIRSCASDPLARSEWELTASSIKTDKISWPRLSWAETTAKGVKRIGSVLYGLTASGIHSQFVFPKAVDTYKQNLDTSVHDLVMQAKVLIVYPTEQLGYGGMTNKDLLEALECRIYVEEKPTLLLFMKDCAIEGKHKERILTFREELELGKFY